MATKPIQPAVNKPVLQSLPIIPVRMGFSGTKQRDPIQKVENDMTALNPDIDNNGGSLYNLEEFCIVHRFECEADKERRENEDEGYGAVTDSQAYFLQETSFYYEQEREDFLEANYDDSWMYDKETYRHYGTNSDDYIGMVKSGEVIDEDGMCKMNPAKMGASLTKEEMDGLGRGNEADAEMEQDASSDSEFEENEPTAEADPSPDDEPAIKSNINLSGQFGKATSIPIESETPAAQPIVIAPTPVAANDRSFSLSA